MVWPSESNFWGSHPLLLSSVETKIAIKCIELNWKLFFYGTIINLANWLCNTCEVRYKPKFYYTVVQKIYRPTQDYILTVLKCILYWQRISITHCSIIFPSFWPSLNHSLPFISLSLSPISTPLHPTHLSGVDLEDWVWRWGRLWSPAVHPLQKLLELLPEVVLGAGGGSSTRPTLLTTSSSTSSTNLSLLVHLLPTKRGIKNTGGKLIHRGININSWRAFWHYKIKNLDLVYRQLRTTLTLISSNVTGVVRNLPLLFIFFLMALL